MNQIKEDQWGEKMVVKTQTLLKVLNILAVSSGASAGMPGDEEPGDPDNPFGPYGPGGPVLRVAAPAFVASQVINTAIMFNQAFEVAQKGEFGQVFQGVGSAMVSQFVDDFCGTPPRRWPFPWPGPWTQLGPRPELWKRAIDRMYKQPQAADLVIAGLQFRNAAGELQDGELKQSMEAAAERLLETGFDR